LEHEAKWIEEQCADSEVEPLALASAAIRMLNDSRGMNLAPPKPEPKQHRRENREDPANRSQRSNRGPRDDSEFSRVNEVEIFVGVGKFAGVRPGDIVGAFANEFGVSGSDIGRVMLFEKNAFVGLPKAVAEQVLDKHEKVTIRGRTTYLSLARGRSGGGGGDDGHGPPTRRKHKGKHLKKGPTSHHRHKKFKR
jgi:ATP-dependent RNA helicase DeaD